MSSASHGYCPPPRRSRRVLGAIAALCFIVVSLNGVPLVAQTLDDALQPWILVVPPVNVSDTPSLDALGLAVADTFELTLALLGAYQVQPRVVADELPVGVVRGDVEILAEFATARTLDYIVTGEVDRTSDGEYVIGFAVFDRGAGAVTVRETEVVASVLDVFDASDRLVQSTLSAFSGQRIAFGVLRLVREGWLEGEYSVFIDGAPAGRTVPSVASVLIGEHDVEIVALTGPQAGEVLVRTGVVISEDEATAVRFAMEPPPPPEVVAEPEGEPEVEPEPVPPPDLPEAVATRPTPVPDPALAPDLRSEPVSDPPPPTLSDLTPADLAALRLLPLWDRRERVTRSIPFLAFGDARGVESDWGVPIPEAGTLNLWADLEFDIGLTIGFGLVLQFTEINSGSSLEPRAVALDPMADIRAGDYTAVRSDTWAIRNSIGWRVWQYAASQVQFDASLLGEAEWRFGGPYILVNGAGELLRAYPAGVEYQRSDIYYGLAVRIRAHWRRLTFRLGAGVHTGDFLLDSDGQDILVGEDWGNSLDTSSGSMASSGVPFSRGSLPLSGYVGLGLGVSMGGEHATDRGADVERLYAHSYRGPAKALSAGVAAGIGGSPTIASSEAYAASIAVSATHLQTFVGPAWPGSLWLDFDRAYGWSFTLQAHPESGGFSYVGAGHRWDIHATQDLSADVRVVATWWWGWLWGAQIDARVTWRRLVGRLSLGTGLYWRDFIAWFPYATLSIGTTFGGPRKSNRIERGYPNETESRPWLSRLLGEWG